MRAPRYVLPPVFAGCVAMLQAQAREPSYDVILRGGMVVDGTGAEPFRADVAIVGDTIAVVGRLDGSAARHEIDAAGRIVTPGPRAGFQVRQGERPNEPQSASTVIA